jgi:tight adherence protein B
MNLVLIALGLAVLLVAQGVYYSVLWWGQRRRDALHERLRSLATPERGTLLRERRLARSPRTAEFLRALGFPERIEKLLLQTDIDATVDVLLGIGLILGVGLTLVLALAMHNAPVAALLGMPVGIATPIVYLLSARARRVRKISAQLPDALDMMVRSLRAGHGVAAGLKLVATEMPVPIAVEFARCFEELQMGGDFRDAVRNMTLRVPDNLDLRIFATSLIIQHETGGNLVEILESIAHTVRERFKFFGKLRALTTEVRMSGHVLGALPFVCALAIMLLNPTYLRPLHQDPLGQAIAVLGLLLWAAGGAWMRRLSKVDY